MNTLLVNMAISLKLLQFILQGDVQGIPSKLPFKTAWFLQVENLKLIAWNMQVVV